jgi:hypothetical protein
MTEAPDSSTEPVGDTPSRDTTRAEALASEDSLSVVVKDPNTRRQIYPPYHCTFAYHYERSGPYSAGCRTRGKFAIRQTGVWGVACRLGNCWLFKKLCVFLPRPFGQGDKMVLPIKIKDYRALPMGAKAGAC